MGQYDYLVPSKSSDTATAPTSNRYSSLIPTSAAPKSSPVSSTPNYAPSLYDQVNPPAEKSPQLPSYVPFADAINFLVPLAKTEIKGAIEGFNETPSAPKTTDFVAGIGGGMGKAAGDAFQSGVDALSAQVPKGNAIERGAFIGDQVVKTIQATFGVALSALQGYATVPIVGNVIDGVNKVFGAISKGASAGAELEVNKLPVSQETKDAILPFAKDSAALAAQMAAGKIAGDFTKASFLKLTDNSKAILTQLQNDPVIRDSIAKQTAGPIQVPIKSETSGAPTPLRINTPTTKHTDYATSQGYEPIVPDNQLPVIQMGAKPKSDISTVSSETAPNVAHEALPADTRFKALSPEDQTTVRTMQRSLFGKGMDWNSAGETALARFEGQKGGSSAPLTVEPINEPSVIPEKTKISPTIKNESPKPVKSPIEPDIVETPKEITPTSGNQVKVQKSGEITKVASDINATLIKQGFDSLTPEEQSHYTPESYKEISDNLTKANPDELKSMAAGEIPLDKKLYGQGQILFKTISQLASKEGDADLMTRLARSPLGKRLSLAAQTLGESGYVKSDGSIDSIKALRQVNDAWEAKLQAKGTSFEKETAEVEKTVKETIKKTVSRHKSWDEFKKTALQALTCAT